MRPKRNRERKCCHAHCCHTQVLEKTQNFIPSRIRYEIAIPSGTVQACWIPEGEPESGAQYIQMHW